MWGREEGAVDVAVFVGDDTVCEEEVVEDMVFDKMLVRGRKETEVSLMALIPCKVR